MYETPLTKEDLDRSECEMPGCAHEDHQLLHFHAACHMQAGLTVVYDRRNGVLSFHCKRCNAHIAAVRL